MNEPTTWSRVQKNSHFSHASFVATFEPKDIGHAPSDHNWVNSMHEELENFERNQVWEFVDMTSAFGTPRLVSCSSWFSDVDFAGCRLDRKSTSGTCQLLGSSSVSWSSRRQSSVAQSTTEAVYVATTSCFS
jgi:hypothetical protein